MAYIISRNNRFYVVAYDGVDPATGRERRRWHSAGTSRADAEAIASSITDINRVPIPRGRDALTLGDYLTIHGCQSDSVESALPPRTGTDG